MALLPPLQIDADAVRGAVVAVAVALALAAAAHLAVLAGLQAHHRLLAVPGDMGRDDHVVAAAQWVRVGGTFKDDFLGNPEPNGLGGRIGRPGGGGFLFGGKFRLEGDEAVVVTTLGGGANYTGFQVSDPWTVSPDPVHRLASLYRSQVLPSADGSVTLVELIQSKPTVVVEQR